LLGVPLALATPHARFNNTAHGGLFITNVNVLSSYAVITTGSVNPSCPWVLALKDLQNSIIFKPCCPSAGPTGGAGFADPAGQ
jgi:hypothetical protein